MIEVEEKFVLTKEALRQIKKHSEFVRREENHDIYYDLPDHSLMLNDRWLRTRDGNLELKWPIYTGKHFNYKEYEEPKKIFEKLDVKYSGEKVGDWRKFLENAGFNVVMDFKCVREKYKAGKFNIDVDNTDFGFGLFEVETMVKSERDIERAEDQIFDFVKKCGIKSRNTFSGKGKIYLKKFNPKLLQMLIEAGVIKIKD